MTGGRGEELVVIRFAGILIAAEAHRDDANAGLAARVVDGAGDEVVVGRIVRFDEQQVCLRGHGVGPLEIEIGFELPRSAGAAGACRISRRVIRRAILGDSLERRRIGKPERFIELLQVMEGGRRVVGIDDRDGLSSAIALNAGERNQIHSVSFSDLTGREADRAGAHRGRDLARAKRSLW